MEIITRTRTEVYHKWIMALISGEYKQTKGQLRYEDSTGVSFCCLGVLCDLAAKDGGEEWEEGFYMNYSSSLPFKIKKWMKLSAYHEKRLMAMNDSGKSFVDISNYIQKYILPKIKD